MDRLRPAELWASSRTFKFQHALCVSYVQCPILRLLRQSGGAWDGAGVAGRQWGQVQGRSEKEQEVTHGDCLLL